MKLFLAFFILLTLISQPGLRAEEKTAGSAEAAGKALNVVAGSEASEEDLGLDDLSVASEIGIEEELEEDEFAEGEAAGTVSLEDSKY